MWIIDLRSSRFLAANRAALRQYGFTAEEFTRLTVHNLLPDTSVSSFLQYIAKDAKAITTNQPTCCAPNRRTSRKAYEGTVSSSAPPINAISPLMIGIVESL